MEIIRLKVPSRLKYRDLAIRMVWSACKLIPRSDDIQDAIISAFSEALNNVVLHGRGAGVGDLEIAIELCDDRLVIRLMDYGESFDPTGVPAPDLDSLPEAGLGVFIMRSFMDDITYVGGTPNTLSMTKFLRADEGTA